MGINLNGSIKLDPTNCSGKTKILKDTKVTEGLSDDDDTNRLLELSLQIYSTNLTHFELLSKNKLLRSH